MTAHPRAVFDCNTLLQALVSNVGPAYACVEEVRLRRCTLFVSDYVLNELQVLPPVREFGPSSA